MVILFLKKDIEIIDIFKQQTNEQEGLNGKGLKKQEQIRFLKSPK